MAHIISAVQFRDHHPQLQGFSQDPLVESYIDEADGLLAGELGYPEPDTGARTLTSATYTLYYSAPSRLAGVLCLCVSPLVSVTSVRVDAVRAYGASTLLTEGVDFDVDLVNGRLALLPGSATTRWPTAYRAIKVVAVAGYATTPSALVPIVAAQVRHLWLRRRVGDQDAALDLGPSVTLQDLEQLIPQAVLQVLDPYRVCT